MTFNTFKQAIAKQFTKMSKHPLFRTAVERDTLWDTYLSAFPPGTNPMYRQRTEHDCSCCRSFIKSIGNVVAIVDGKLVSIWDINIPDEPAYQTVADALSTLVKSAPVCDLFLSDTKTIGTDKNFEQLVDGQKTWEHFFVNVPAQFVTQYPKNIPSFLGEFRSRREVFHRGLSEITIEALETILELIDQNSLYRGAEHRHAVVEALKHHRQWNGDVLYTWLNTPAIPFRNTVIGTLAVDLSEGVSLDKAVTSFENKVAPANYKRPTALVTKAQVEAAKKAVEDAGLTSALSRRFATLQDITVNNILFIDRASKAKLEGSVFDDIATHKPPRFDKVEEIPIDKFLADILPKAQSLEVLFENKHNNRLVSLIAPVDPTAAQLFKWSNPFSWSYTGNMADSIKERVKHAGGNVEGDLCCRLAWDYTDDLDFYMHEPGGFTIYFLHRRKLSVNGGMLDVDANGCDGLIPNPCENIFYKDKGKMRDGLYRLEVNNYSRRSDGVGFEVEIEVEGQTHHLAYDRVVPSKGTVKVADIEVKKGVITVNPHLPSTFATKTFWGINTNTFHKVNVLMHSPNFWDDQVGIGNKHYFFILDNCTNDGSARGFFNEFLKSDLDKHRKVLEMVGGKLPVANTAHQLSGLGFSSTQHDSLVCRVEGSFTRIIKIIF